MPELPKTIASNIDHFTGRTWLLPSLLQWCEHSNDRTLILTVEPGTGKSALMAWLAGAGPPPADARVRSQLEQLRSLVTATHFCVATSGSTSPKAFAQNIAEQLTRCVAGFGGALAATLADQIIKISPVQHIGTVQGGNVTGVYIEKLDLGGLDDEPSFNRVVREPLKQLYKNGYDKPVLLLVDALDEAATYTGSINIVQLLARLTDLPPQIRVLVTTRPDPRVLYLLHECKRFDLIQDVPAGMDDVRLYAYERLAALAEEQRALLADRISQAAEGIFLYAHLVLQELLPRLHQIPDLAVMPLPSGLSGLYLEFLNRDLGGKRPRWFNTFRPVVGLIAVAQGEGLNRAQIEEITGQDVEEALEASKQYLDGELPEGPFRPFHKSFTDFLLEDEGNVAYHIDAARMHRQIADHYWAIRNGTAPWSQWDDYGLRHTATHLAEAAEGTHQQTERHQQVERLITLAVDRNFQEAHKARVKDLAALQRDLQLALRATAADSDTGAIRLVVESALALVTFRREELRPEPLFEMARRGEVDAAARRLELFDVDPEWRQATLLTIAWLAAESRPDEAVRLRNRLRESLVASSTLDLLLARLNTTLEGGPLPGVGLPEAPSAELARELVARMSGEGADAELLTAHGFNPLSAGTGAGGPGEMISATGYLAEHDGPLLMAFAAAHPQEGDVYFRQYLDAHTSYNYVQYRNRSLWLLLNAVLRHPDQKWVRAMVAEMAAAALAGSTLEFQECLPLTILALQALAQKPGALQELEARRGQAVADTDRLQSGRRQGDTWGSHKRRLVALAQTFSRLLGRHAEAAELLDKALSLPYGFAGFQAPALLTLAEALRICTPNHGALTDVLKAARAAAHNIQDATFCARMTARVNAMTLRWWKSPGFDVEVMSRKLSQDTSAPEFAALHWIGEVYSERSPMGGILLPDDLRQANTLRALAEVYHRPLAEFQRLNREQGWAVDEPLPPATPVNVPDGGFETLLAARLAAEALVETSLPEQRRIALIQSLVPIAAANLTALDTVLSRLLLTARPTDVAVLEVLERTAKQHLVEGESHTEVRPPSGIPA